MWATTDGASLCAARHEAAALATLPPHPNIPTLVGAGLTSTPADCPVGGSPSPHLFLRLQCGGRRVTTLPYWVAAEARDSLAVLRVAFQVLQVSVAMVGRTLHAFGLERSETEYPRFGVRAERWQSVTTHTPLSS